MMDYSSFLKKYKDQTGKDDKDLCVHCGLPTDQH